MSVLGLRYLHDSSGNLVTRKPAGAVPPQILGQPVKQVAALGDTATFSVVVADVGAVTFQWKFNGTDIPGATGDSLLLTNVSADDEGQYSVVVTNPAGSVTSTPADLLLDTDDDGLPDTWEAANFTDPDPTHPLNPANQRSENDPDKDGVSNLDEFLDGTNPTDKASLRLRLSVYTVAAGSVMIEPMKLSYDVGETVTLTALPFPPSVFMDWSKDLIGNANPATLTMDKNKTVRARFASAASLPLGLIALWRGETNASDLIGGHHGDFFAGTEIIAPSVTDSGKVGGAFNFDGTQHVEVPDSPALRPAQLTVEAWVFPTSVPNVGFATIIARGSSGDTWDLCLGNNFPTFFSHGAPVLQALSAIPLNEWTHLAITFDGSIRGLYVNGAQVASHEQGGALLYEAAIPITIGSDFRNNQSGNHFSGRIDEVAIYNRALTVDEVFSIYTADFLGKNFSQPYFTSPSQLPDAVLGANYAQQLTTLFGTAPVVFSLSEGLLPIGMTLSPTGLVSGILSASGSFRFTVLATDATGAFTEQMCLLRVL